MISNATPIICLAKINQLDILKKLFNKIIIPEDVKNEIIIKGKAGYSIILDAINQGWIKVKNPRFNPDLGLGKGENAAINLAKEETDSLIIDDAFAIKVAYSLNIEYIRTSSLIFSALKNKIINKKQAKDIIHELIKTGYYLSPSLFSEILRIIDSYK